MAEGGASTINDTSKPRGTYLDPLKACALSGESCVPFGKSESATFAKFTAITRQMKRNASRASVLNDVERSRYDSVVRRIDGEREYNVSVLDRQFRQLQRSLARLERQRRSAPIYSKSFASRDSFRNHGGLPRTNKRPNNERAGGLNLPPITDLSEKAPQLDREAKERAERLKRERDFRLLADDLSEEFPSAARRVQSLPVVDRPGFIARGMPRLPNRFYDADEDFDPNGVQRSGKIEIERLPSI